MLGRVRPSSSSLECLELERSPPKIIKDDSLSIYETTLMKLRQGSQRDLSSLSENSMNAYISSTSASIPPYEEALTIDYDCSSASISRSDIVCQSLSTLKEPQKRNLSILYLFSRYKSSRKAPSSPDEAMAIENGCSSSSVSPESGNTS
ncbi:uncharacterized protein LOC132302314 [Cornus florida]|uniref:uncharacterized protein LOC132302314 n=1 Tax=Cornus florida TaxID=4283 RepID=UPI0028A08D05|nr:uncharacterized protein LOC132302314 [Cornus florida]